MGEAPSKTVVGEDGVGGPSLRLKKKKKIIIIIIIITITNK